MRIGFDAKRLYNNFTGLGNYSRTLIINLLACHPENDYFLYSPKVPASPLADSFMNDPALTTYVPSTVFKSFWRSSGIVNQLRKDRIEIYHGLSGEIPFIRPGQTIKTVVTVHDLIFRVYPATYRPADRFIYNRKFRYACDHADRIVAISESTKADIVKFYGIDDSRIVVIYPSCDPLFYAEPEDSVMKQVSDEYNLPGEFLLYVGSVIPRKNLEGVIRAIDLLPAGIKIPLVIVGDGGRYKEEIKRLVSEKHLEKHVIWVRNLKETRNLKALYNLSSIFIYPSVYEGFGLPVAEALLSGTPVITSDVSSLPEAGGNAAIKVDPFNSEHIANAIEKILTDNNLRESMISEGMKYTREKFSGGKSARALNDLYKDIW